MHAQVYTTYSVVEYCAQQRVERMDPWPFERPVPDIAEHMLCRECGSENITSMPNWLEMKGELPVGCSGSSGFC
jgi:hypothetical protein